MSVQALSWALNDAPDVPAELVAVLVGLANHADEEGRNAFPAQARLARYARKSDRSVRNDLAALLAIGLIREGDRRLVAHIPGGRRPKVYDLAMERRAEPTDRKPTSAHDRKPTSGHPGTGLPVTPEADVRSGRKPTSDEPSEEPSEEEVGTEGDRPARTRASAAEPDVEAPPPAAARPIPPEEKARLQALGDEARRATAQARAEAAARDETAIAGCDRCDDHGLLPTRVPCMHPRQPPPPGSGRAAFRAARAELEARLEAKRSAGDPGSGLARVADVPLVVPSHGDDDRPATPTPPTSWSVCSTCGRAQRHLPGCPDDPANGPPLADTEEVLAAADRIAVEDAELLARLDDEPGPDPITDLGLTPDEVWGSDAPPF